MVPAFSACSAVISLHEGARLGLAVGALLFCSDNTTAPRDEDRLYGGLRNPATRRAFEAGADTVIDVLTGFTEDEPPRRRVRQASSCE
jgi:hypothetical protein